MFSLQMKQLYSHSRNDSLARAHQDRANGSILMLHTHPSRSIWEVAIHIDGLPSQSSKWQRSEPGMQTQENTSQEQVFLKLGFPLFCLVQGCLTDVAICQAHGKQYGATPGPGRMACLIRTFIVYIGFTFSVF